VRKKNSYNVSTAKLEETSFAHVGVEQNTKNATVLDLLSENLN
jgi:hypothetical protein